jgi:hypothetical protein
MTDPQCAEKRNPSAAGPGGASIKAADVLCDVTATNALPHATLFTNAGELMLPKLAVTGNWRCADMAEDCKRRLVKLRM